MTIPHDPTDPMGLQLLVTEHAARVEAARLHHAAEAKLPVPGANTATLDALPRERQGDVAAWAAVSAWTEAYESAQGAVWGRLADAATPLARSLGDDAETAREADDLATLGAAAWGRL